MRAKTGFIAALCAFALNPSERKSRSEPNPHPIADPVGYHDGDGR